MHTFTFCLRRAARSAGLVTVGVLSTFGALSLSHVGPAQAQSPGVNLAQLVATVNALKSQQATDEATITSLQSTVKSQDSTITSQGSTITSLQTSLSSVQSKQGTDESNISTDESNISTDESNIAANTTSIGKLQTLTASFSLSSDPSAGGTNTLLTISGVNVQIVNGQGSTETTNGLGNLIVGYNEKDTNFTQDRTGSHNIVVGTAHNYLSYGGLVAGQDNLISAPYATVTGGYLNVARSGHASVSGGSGNVASGGSASVTGGQYNKASADYASVTGGQGNAATSGHDSVSGGYSNTASGGSSSVSGGKFNTVTGLFSTISGGQSNTVSSGSSSISGGRNITEKTSYGWKAGSEVPTYVSVSGNFVSDDPF